MNNKSHNYISLDVIANKIYKNPLLKDTNYEDIIDFALSVIKIAKVPGVYQEESCYKDVIDFKVAIPKSALNIKSVSYCSGNKLIPMLESTNTLANQIDKIKYPLQQSHTYSIGNSLIKTSCKEGKIFIVFDTIKLDEDDIPMIPDSEALLRAIEAYIKIQIYSVMVDMGKVSERALNRVEQEYYFNIGKAQTEFQEFTNEDSMESFINGWKRQFPTSHEYSGRYDSESKKENLNRL